MGEGAAQGEGWVGEGAIQGEGGWVTERPRGKGIVCECVERGGGGGGVKMIPCRVN